MKSLLKVRLHTQLRIYLQVRQVFQMIFQFLLWKKLLILTATNHEWLFEKQFFSCDTKKCWNNSVLKKEIRVKKKIRLISILTNFSKVFERLIYNQVNEFMATKFSNFLTGFRKNHNTQYALLRMIENSKPVK